MKRIITLALSIMFAITAFGQRLEYERTSNWFFGLNAGAAWNTTDVQNKTYAGWGFLFGRSYNYDYGRRLSYDLRLRYLHGKWYGQDTDSTNLSHLGADYSGALSGYKDGLGYTVNNFEANVHELGLELAIHFNRFRDRTGWDPYIFGGANMVWNETYGDLLDQDFFLAGDSLTYAYDQISMNKPEIQLALDDNYESALDGTPNGKYNFNFMPSLGIGLGYDFSPRFSMGIEHKTTFALKDNFDGYVDAEPNWGFLENDVYHYTSAYLTWRFRGRGSVNTNTRPTPTPIPVAGATTTPPCQFPDVRTTKPLQRTESVDQQAFVFRAEVRFVQSRNQIELRVNGVVTTNFLYNPDTHQLESYLNLQPGNNTIEIIGRNNCGTDTETSTIIYNNCIDPVVTFLNVSGNTFTAQVERRDYTVQAQISNATSVEFTVNGVRNTNFTYNSTTGQFSSNILLNQGQNTVRITAVSACGTDTETSVVTYTDCADPLINFANGNNGFLSVSQPNFDLKAYVYNVASQSNITVRLNGSIRNFNFNTSSKLVTASLALNAGQNTIQISSTTSCGTDTETLTIQYAPCVNPSIQITQPMAQSTATANGTQVVRATMTNVSNINQIQLFVNGNLQQGGTYNAITKVFEASVALNSGFNSIQVTVLNDCGSDTETISVNYNPCNSPDVQMILPSANGGLVSSPSQLVQAMVFNVNNISEIRTYVNGTVQNGGTFNSINGLYQNTVGLALGLNTIQVVATNSCGSDVQTVTVTYRACEAPVITLVSPNTNPFNTNATNINVAAMVGSISTASQVQLTVNGVVDASGATYSSTSLVYSNNVALIPGNNTIVINATNDCGTVTKQINIIREIVIIDTPNEDVDSIVICFVNSNNVGSPVTLTIPLSSWPAYQSQGAQLGPCPIVVEPVDLPMTICYTIVGTPTTIQILTSEWPAYQALGATQGACQEETMTICFNENNLTIPVSQWSQYQGQGATEGPCPIIPIETIVICLNGTEMTVPTTQWSTYQAQGATLGACPTIDPAMVICLNGTQQTILTSQWATFQAQGATQGPCLVVVDPPMTICMVVNGVRTTLTILTSEWPSYQAQGAMEGPCPSIPDPSITICVDVNGVPTTMTILTSQWATYQAQGATMGACVAIPDPSIPICLNGVPMTILTSQWATYQAQGATQGPCPVVEETMIICHRPPGNPTNTQQLEIPVSAWAAHLAHGDVMGPCPAADPEMTICLNGTEMTILTSQWATYQAQGATQGPCPVVEETMIICHRPPGNPTNTQQLEIPVSAWAAHLAHGDVMGPCPAADPEMTICMVVNGVRTTLTILTSQWATYQAQGATQGPCPSLPDPSITICMLVNDVPTTMTILTSQWASYQAQGATMGACPAADPQITVCLNGTEMTILTSEWPSYQAQGATVGPCTVIEEVLITICLGGQQIEIPEAMWGDYASQGATRGPCPDDLIQICLNGVEMEIPRTEWIEYKAQGATQGPCPVQTMTICYSGSTKEISVSDWARYQGLGATMGACIDLDSEGIENADTLNGNINRPTNGGGDDDELLFGNRMITICHTPNGSIASQTMQIPMSQWEQYQLQGASLGPCTGNLNPSGGTGTIDVNTNGTSTENGVGGVPINPNGTGGTNPTGGNMQQVGNGSQQATNETLRKEKEAKEAAAAKARQEQAVKDAAAQKAIEEQKAKDAAAAKAKQEQAAKDAAAQEAAAAKIRQEQAVKIQQEQAAKEAAAAKAREEQKAKEAAAAKARQEQAAKDAAAAKARQEQAAKDAAAKKAAQEEAARKQAEEAKRKAAQEAAAAKARQEQAVKEAAAKKAAQEEAKRKADESAKAAAAKKAADEAAKKKAVEDAAAKKAAEEAAKKKAEEEQKLKEKEGGR